MRFLWPENLWLLLLAPALLAAYLHLLRRKQRHALKFPSLQTVRAAMTASGAWRRHLPPAIFLLAIVGALFAAARPMAVVTLPHQKRVIILAIDVSLSMRAADVQPNRIVAAQEAARVFVQDLPSDVRVGIVSFAGTALLAQAPTRLKEDLVAAIDRLQLDRQTAIGSGIIVSLATLFPDDAIDLTALVLPYQRYGRGAQQAPRARPDKTDKPAQKKVFTPVEPGSNHSAAIILLTDGRRTTGPHPVEAARMAAERGIRVFTVGFGTAAGSQVSVEGYSIYMAFDEETLKGIADITRAEYFHASTGAELKQVYEKLSSKLVLQREPTEITFLFAAASTLLLLLAGALSLLWFNRTL